MVNPIPIKLADDFISSTINNGSTDLLIPKRTQAVVNEIMRAITYGFIASASRMEVFTTVDFSVGLAASTEFLSKKPPAALATTRRNA
ncbi:unannotated protein [freshwater metagenome]|uniref:Unannotated protein n=1 Tax=freshwater metagenome TaxID=449393 RepID=A0A6J6ZGC2_9ZZZZ